jgi:micrococcal nuclease
MGLCNSKLEKLDDSIELFSLNNKIFDAKIVKVYDGDTCFAVFMLNNKPVKFKIRMMGYDSPEMKPLLSNVNRNDEIKKAIRARDELIKLVLNKCVKLECGKWDKYGRLLGTIYIENNLCVNLHMIENNFGYKYNGGKKITYS